MGTNGSDHPVIVGTDGQVRAFLAGKEQITRNTEAGIATTKAALARGLRTLCGYRLIGWNAAI